MALKIFKIRLLKNNFIFFLKKCVALPNILVNDVKCSCNGKIRQCFLSMLLHDA